MRHTHGHVNETDPHVFAKETPVCQKRPMYVCQKRHAYVKRDPCMHVKRAREWDWSTRSYVWHGMRWFVTFGIHMNMWMCGMRMRYMLWHILWCRALKWYTWRVSSNTVCIVIQFTIHISIIYMYIYSDAIHSSGTSDVYLLIQCVVIQFTIHISMYTYIYMYICSDAVHSSGTSDMYPLIQSARPYESCKIFKGRPRRNAFSKLVHRQYKSFPPDRFCQVEIQNATGLSNKPSTA